MESTELLLQCVAHDYALHEIKNATVLVRRVARNPEVQKEMRILQDQILKELEHRKQADEPGD